MSQTRPDQTTTTTTALMRLADGGIGLALFQEVSMQGSPACGSTQRHAHPPPPRSPQPSSCTITRPITPFHRERKRRKKPATTSLSPHKLGSKRLIRCWHTKHRLCLPVRWSLSTELWFCRRPAVATPFASIRVNILHRRQRGRLRFDDEQRATHTVLGGAFTDHLERNLRPASMVGAIPAAVFRKASISLVSPSVSSHPHASPGRRLRAETSSSLRAHDGMQSRLSGLV